MLRRAAQWLRRTLGRRGAILLSYGAVWILYGAGQLTNPQPDLRGLRLLLYVMPLDAWAGCWITAGCAALIAAFMPSGDDWVGFIALAAISVPWTGSYLASWWPLHDNPRGWIVALIYMAITVPVLVVAGWREPPRTRRPDDMGRV